MGLALSAHEILVPYVGETVADTCVRATALSLGKSSDGLDQGDLPAMEANIRRLLVPVAPRAAIEGMLAQLRSTVTL